MRVESSRIWLVPWGPQRAPWLPFCHMMGRRWQSAIQKRALTRIQPCWHPYLRIPRSITWEISSVAYKPPRYIMFCYSSLNRLRYSISRRVIGEDMMKFCPAGPAATKTANTIFPYWKPHKLLACCLQQWGKKPKPTTWRPSSDYSTNQLVCLLKTSSAWRMGIKRLQLSPRERNQNFLLPITGLTTDLQFNNIPLSWYIQIQTTDCCILDAVCKVTEL